MEDALDRAKIKASNISQILLVGGSTRIPIINEIIKKVMKKNPTKGVNVDEAVACGAAIFAGLQNKGWAQIQTKKSFSKVEIKDICPHNLGTIVAAIDPERNQAMKINSIIIPRDFITSSITIFMPYLYDGQSLLIALSLKVRNLKEDIEFVITIIAKEPCSSKKC